MLRLRVMMMVLPLTALLVPAAHAGSNTWSGTGPFATSLGNKVITALAVSGNSGTVYAGNGSGTLFSYAVIKLPTATTGSASNVTATGATLNGTVNDNGATTAVTFDHGASIPYGTSVAATTPSGGSISAGTGGTSAAVTISGLACNTTYHFRVNGVNSAGTTNGGDGTFTTSACAPPPRYVPYVPTATSATLISATGFTARWNGVGGATGYYLDVATDSGFTRLVSGSGNLDVGNVTRQTVTGLASNTTYYYRVRAYNGNGTSGDSNTISLTTGQNRVVTSRKDNGPGSLRDTITGAGAGDTITFDSSLNGQTITLTTGSLIIAKDLTITGPGASSLTISGNNSSRAFQVSGTTAFTLQNLTIANGNAANGGALIDNAASTTIISGCLFGNNTATANGGALNATGAMTINDTLFSGNSAVLGGAIQNNYATLNLTNVTLHANRASSNGGGIYNAAGTTTVVSNTISGNSAASNGGGIYNAAGILNLENSVVANNTVFTGASDMYGTVISRGHNLVKETSGAVFIARTGDITTGDDPKLGVLTDNGGPTKTMALLSGSPAINAGACSGGLSTDQRGMIRPQGGACDIGAYERALPAALTATGGTRQSTLINTAFTTPLTAKVTDSLGGALDGNLVIFFGPASGAGIASNGGATTGVDGVASYAATANAKEGTYLAYAFVFNSLSAIYSLTNSKNSQSISSITFTPATLIVGGSTTASAMATSGLSVTYSSLTKRVCTISGGKITGITAGTCTIAADQAGNANYNAASTKTRSITVGKGGQNIIFGAAPIVVVNGTGTVSATGGSSGNVVTFSGKSPSVCAISGGTVTGIIAGTCIIAADQAGNANYNAASTKTQSFVVGKKSQSIIFGAAPIVVVGGTGVVRATGGKSGNVVTFSGSTPSVCTISGTIVTGVTAGTCTIAADQAGNSTYGPAPRVTRDIMVDPALALDISTLPDGAVVTASIMNISGTVTNPAKLTSLTVNGAAVKPDTGGGFSYPVQLIAGANMVKVAAANKLGESVADTRKITLDESALKLTVNSLADNETLSKNYVTVMGTVTTPSAIADPTAVVTWSVNGSTPHSAALTDTTYNFTANLNPGMNTIRIMAANPAGITAQIKRTINYRQPFTLSVIDPETDIRTVKKSYLLVGNVSDNSTPVAVTIKMDGQTYTPEVKSDGTFQQQLILGSANIYQVFVTGVDQNGNSLTVQRNFMHTPASSFTAADPLLAIRIASGGVKPTPSQIRKLDVAPMVNGVSVGDGVIDMEDVAIIQKIVDGLIK